MTFIPFKRLFSSQFAKNSGSMSISGLFQAVIAFMSNLVLVRFIDPEGFGRYAMTLASIALVMTIFSLQIGLQVVRTKDHDFDEAKKAMFFNAMLQGLILTGSIAFFVLYFIQLLTWWSVSLLVAALISQFAENNKVFFERKMPYVKLSALEAGVNGGGHVLSVFVVVLGGNVLALYIRDLFYGIATLVWLRQIHGFSWYKLRLLNINEWNAILRNIKGVWLDAVLDSSFSRIVMILAAYVGGEKGAGYLLQAYRLAGVQHQLLAPLAGRISFNWFSRQNSYAKRYGGLKLLIGYLSIPSALGAITIFLFAEKLVPFFFGDVWTPAAHLLVSLTGYIMFVSLFDLLRVFLIATYQTNFLLAMRTAQYFGIGIIMLPLLAGVTLTENNLSIGVSVAYTLACMTGIWLIRANSGKSSHQDTPA